MTNSTLNALFFECTTHSWMWIVVVQISVQKCILLDYTKVPTLSTVGTAIGEKTIKNDQKRSKNDLTSHTQLHGHVRLFYPLTYIFGTFRDWTHDNNAAIFDCFSIGMKKDTRREEENVITLLNFYFFNFDKKHQIYSYATIVHPKHFNGPSFSARFEIVHTMTTLQRLSEWFAETKKLEGPTSVDFWGSFFFKRKIWRILFWKKSFFGKQRRNTTVHRVVS